MYKPIILIKIILLAMSPFVFAQAQIDEIDPHVVSPTMYKVILENEHVRVVEYQVLPGEKDNWHTHPAKASYIVSGGSLKITTEKGGSFIVKEEMGAATWFEAVGKHYGENVGTTPVRIVFVEIKEIKSTREDINKYRRDGNRK